MNHSSDQARLVHGDVHEIVAALEKAPDMRLAIAALCELRRGVMTGEGPTTQGRVHFSRTIDAQDTLLCERILVAAGCRTGAPVSREEAEVLFDIHAAALDREDEGRFDELFAKAVAHHVLAAAGRRVPPRDVALAQSTPLESWAGPDGFEAVDREIASWLASQVRSTKRTSVRLNSIIALLIGAGSLEMANSIASVLDVIS
ncbi:MAG TPA: hypothetical protein VHN11_09155 [Xanthobacteraceae bacterium]|jgi:hypothetical protein|nr:hypothetical protein [Xanthobacteraceae bacterium]